MREQDVMGNKLGYFLFGIVFIAFGVHSLLTGETFGIGNLATATRYVSFEANPIEFSLVLLFCFGFGGALIWATFKR